MVSVVLSEVKMNLSKGKQLVSVIIPTHNRPQLLMKAVKSVICQTYRPIEIIIIDDGSNEPVTSEWFKKVDKNVSICIKRNESGTGVAAARNVGIRSAKGEMIAFLDDDDRWMPAKLERQVEALNRHRSFYIRGVYCQMIFEDESGKEISRTCFPSMGHMVRRRMIYTDGNIPPPSVLVDRDALFNIGLFDESMPAFEDRHWALRFLTQYDMICVDEYLVRILEHTGSRLSSYAGSMLVGERAYTHFIQNYLKEQGVGDISKAMGYRYAKLANEYMLSGDTRSGMKTFLRSMAINPFEKRAYIGFILGLGGAQLYKRIMARRMLRVRLAAVSINSTQ